jgi:hypothetical protein
MKPLRSKQACPATVSPGSLKVVPVVFCATVLALLTFGFVMLTSTSSFYAYRGDPFYYAKRQALWLGIGLAACAATVRIDYRRHRKFAWALFIVAAILLAGVLIFGKRINGAARWLVFGPIRFQPSARDLSGLLAGCNATGTEGSIASSNPALVVGRVRPAHGRLRDDDAHSPGA